MPARIRFGSFELDPRTGRLCSGPTVVPLQEKPLRLLELLVERPGELVTREQLAAALWPDAHVDFDNSLNNAVSRLRCALREDVARPEWIETVGRRGYRFIAPVTRDERAEPRALAVLPLVPLGPDVQDWLADGLTEALIAELARLGGLRVVSATTAMRYRNAGKPLARVARELGVDTVVEGSVALAGTRVRVVVRLIDGATDTFLWSTSCEHSAADVLGMQAQVAQAIASEMKIDLSLGERARMAAAPRASGRVQEAYLKGRHHWNKRTEAGLRRAIGFFQAAIEEDAEWAPAYVGLADCYNSLATVPLGAPPARIRPLAVVAAERAIALDPGLGEAHASLAYARLYDADWAGAEDGLQRAVQLRPGYAEAHAWSAHLLGARGRHAEAIHAARRAQELDPLSVYVRLTHGFVLYLAGCHEQAGEEYESALELEPSGLVQGFSALNHLAQGALSEAIRGLEDAIATDGRRPALLGWLAAACAAAGVAERSRALRDELAGLAAQGYVPPAALAFAAFAAGDDEDAYRWLHAACEERANVVIYFAVVPYFSAHRADPRFKAVLARVGLS